MVKAIQSEQYSIPLSTLREAGVVPVVSDRLLKSADSIAAALQEHIVDEVSAYTESGNPDVLPELQQHLALHVVELRRLLAGTPPGELGFVRAHAQRRAEQKFPLDAVLQSYRCSLRVLSQWIRDAAIDTAKETAHVHQVVAAVNDLIFDYTDTISTLLTTEYVARTRLLAEAEGDRRTELLNILLRGYDESDNQAAKLLRRGGYLEQRQSFCIAVARSVDPREMENTARAQRMLDSVKEVLHNLPIRSLCGVRDNLVIVVMSGTRRLSGWTAPQSLLADRVYPQLRTIGPAALVGLSADAPSTSHIPRALSEAKLALDFSDVANRVMPYARIPFRHMLVRLASENIQSALPAWLDDFIVADGKSRGALTGTLQAYADADMNVLKTAKDLSLHPNTIYARMQKIDNITGKNALAYNDLTELLLATECVRPL